jgi:hypothetical protein
VTRRTAAAAALAALVAGGAAATVVLVAGGGGGNGGGGELTPAEYLARASAACTPFARQLDRIVPPDLGSPADVAATVSRALPLLRRQADAVRRIPPPPVLAERVRRFFALNDRALAALAAALDAARRNDRAALGPRLGAWFDAGGAAHEASQRAGFRC